MKSPKLNRLALRVLVVLAGCLLLTTAWAPTSAGQTCATANLSSLMGQTCDIGSLQFTFTSWDSQNYMTEYVDGSLTFVYGTQWTASDFIFTPVSGGFSLTFLGGAQSFSLPEYSAAGDMFALSYSVINLNGNPLQLHVTGGEVSSTEDAYGHGDFGVGQAGYALNVCSPECISSLAVSYASTGGSYGSTNIVNGYPFSDGADGIAEPFNVNVSYGGSASWDGAPTIFTFGSPTPEPASFVLFGTGLLAIAFLAQRKLIH